MSKVIKYKGATYIKVEAKDPLGSSDIMIDSIETHTKWSKPLLDKMRKKLADGTLPEGGEEALAAAAVGFTVASRAAYRSWSIMNSLIQGSGPVEYPPLKGLMDEIEAAEKTMDPWPKK